MQGNSQAVTFWGELELGPRATLRGLLVPVPAVALVNMLHIFMNCLIITQRNGHSSISCRVCAFRKCQLSLYTGDFED